MLYSGFIILPRSVFWSASFNGRSDNTDVIQPIMKQQIAKILGSLNAPVSNQFRLASSGDILALENKLEVSLPESYRCFLQYHSNRKVIALTPAALRDDLYIERLQGFPSDLDSSEYDFVEFDSAYTGPDAISIGSDAFGGQFLMFLIENANERIYFYDTHGEGGDFQEDDSWLKSGMSFKDLPRYDELTEKPQAFINFTYVAPTFLDFLNLLTQCPTDAERPILLV